MARAILSAIVEQLGPFISSEFTLTATVKQEVQKLETKFRTIQAVLNDAEKRQLKEEAVKLWLDKLKGVSYQMDDVLDEWNTAMIKEEIEKQQREDENAETSTTKKRKRIFVVSDYQHLSQSNLSNFGQTHKDTVSNGMSKVHPRLDSALQV